MKEPNFIESTKQNLLDKLDTIKEMEKGEGVEQIAVTSKEWKECMERLREAFLGIKDQLGRFMDMKEDHKHLVALWIIGTYLHHGFQSFPFLYINAMRGSGKTRLLKIIEKLCKNGKLTNSMTEAVLFRTAEKNSIIIDEIEGIGSKEKTALRELLNSCYKKGSVVERMRKKHTSEGDQQVVEQFQLYTPIAMANIWGMEEVLGDRCISLILEKSSNKHKIMLVEDFETNNEFYAIKSLLNELNVVWCSVVTLQNMYKEWNNYVDNKYNYITTVEYNYTKQHHDDKYIVSKSNYDLFQKIHKIGIDGRNLELFMPLLIISNLMGEKELDDTLRITGESVNEKKKDEFSNSRDVAVIDFVSQKQQTLEYFSVKDLSQEFRLFIRDDDSALDWLNSKWFGRALKRLGLIIKKKRVTRGMEVMLDVIKATERIKMFKVEDDDE